MLSTQYAKIVSRKVSASELAYLFSIDTTTEELLTQNEWPSAMNIEDNSFKGTSSSIRNDIMRKRERTSASLCNCSGPKLRWFQRD